ncbi:spore coat associated protein CotJA [Ruminococcus sp. MCC718]|uniref:Spore coat associated protein CotJA n=1 Tax=Hominisplanchenecus faecis TaxID=2885351 RepID=A0ABS8EW51_9FIRM|nr:MULTISPECIES: spore coat associated protein CotJA [Clostridia]MBT9653008.1 spore coat associated protein CotJA [Ruminococcus sp. MCC718]MCC2149184.1 spore coat associated protein CotJA [Hominisplanchenecus faecis]
MAYVPWQKFDKSFSLCHALKAGTIFPCLEKPFCGKGGRCQ